MLRICIAHGTAVCHNPPIRRRQQRTQFYRRETGINFAGDSKNLNFTGVRKKRNFAGDRQNLILQETKTI